MELLFERKFIGRSCLDRGLLSRFLCPLELALLLLFLLALLAQFLLPFFESVVALWQEYSQYGSPADGRPNAEDTRVATACLLVGYHSSRPSSSRKAATMTSEGKLGASLKTRAASRSAGEACCPLRRRN